MGQMRNYLVWLGERFQQNHPEMTWADVMEAITDKNGPFEDELANPEYSIKEYIKEESPNE